jgi:hypothetical protein
LNPKTSPTAANGILGLLGVRSLTGAVRHRYVAWMSGGFDRPTRRVPTVIKINANATATVRW